MTGINVTIQLPAELLQLVESIRLWTMVLSVAVAVLVADRLFGGKK